MDITEKAKDFLNRRSNQKINESTPVDEVELDEGIDFRKVNDGQLKGWLKVFKNHTGNPWSGFKDDVKRAEKEAKKRGLDDG